MKFNKPKQYCRALWTSELIDLHQQSSKIVMLPNCTQDACDGRKLAKNYRKCWHYLATSRRGRGNGKNDRKIVKTGRKVALLSLYLLYLYHVWKSSGERPSCPRWAGTTLSVKFSDYVYFTRYYDLFDFTLVRWDKWINRNFSQSIHNLKTSRLV